MRDFLQELSRRKVIRVAIAYLIGAWLVIQVAETILPNIGLPNQYVTLVIGLVAAGFPLALILSWAFDLTPAGVKRTSDGDDAGPSIAVLPFPDMSEEQDQQHFCDGLTVELLNVLSGIPGLRVASRTSTFSLKNKQVDLSEVAERFNVEHVLEGSVRKSGNKIRVTAQLIEVAKDAHVWSETYDRDLDDIFAIQDDIAACILETLRLKLGTTRSAEYDTSNTRAYEYFLRGRGYAITKSSREVALAAQMFLKAVELDPDFTRAWIYLSEMCAIHIVFYGDNDLWQEQARMAEQAIARLLPGSAESMLASGYALLARRRFAEAEEQFLKAAAVDGDSGRSHHYAARAQVHLGKLADAARSFALATQCDPEDYESPLLAVSTYVGIGQRVEAKRMARIGLQRAEKVLEDYPDNPRAYYLGAAAHELLGDLDKAREWTERALQLSPGDLATQYNAACFFAKIGENDHALELLEDSIMSKAWVENDPDFDTLRDDPRYKAIVAALPD